jgi:benzoyl-CoA reductase/2-hydroxyglutaryl-CoA dehydratase subunit BcrC/BadD/HgdB
MAQLEAQRKLKKILENYFVGMKSPIAWCTSAGPAEILRALGFEVYFPENHGAMLGASRLAGKYIPKAHQAGFAGEICSYLTADIGAWLMNETPLSNAYGLKSIPKPDMIVFNTNQCREVAEWFNFYGREFNCPVVGIYPPRYLEDISQPDIDNVVAQFKNVISVGEKVNGKKLDPKELEKAVALSFDATQLWKQVLETARNKPSPLSFFDGTILMAPIVMLRGTKICVDFYQETLNELKELSIKTKTDSNEYNQIRLYWEGMPIWGRLRSLAEFFVKNNSAVVASTYCNSWIFEDFDSKNPLESMALAYTKIFINRGENSKLNYMEKILNEFEIDGIIFHDSKTCFNNTNSRFGLPKRLKDSTGIDTLTIDGDLNDLRFFSDGQTQTKLETFIEQVKSKKK